MTPPPLAIVQARMGSRRFPGKMLADLGGKPLVHWAAQAACYSFGSRNVVAALPASPENDALADVLTEHIAVFRWAGHESDVLGRFHACAHRYRWDPHSVIVRVTADDPFKDSEMMKRVAAGERLPVEQGGEAFTLAMLDKAHTHERDNERREHISHALFEYPAPPPPKVGQPWSIDTPEDLERARAWFGFTAILGE